MAEKMSNSENNQTLILVVLGAIFFFMVVMPWLNESCSKNINKIAENFGDFNQRLNSSSPLGEVDKRKCSPKFCKFTQWPLPADLRPRDNRVSDAEAAEVIGSNFSCGWGEGSGCVGFTKADYDYLADRGNNSTNSTACYNP
jgi:hypothetical protein